MAGFQWTRKKEAAADALADGKKREEAADIAGVAERTIYRWQNEPEFMERVNQLTVVTGIATVAERIRIAKRMVNSLDYTEKDLLDWLKYVKDETDALGMGADIAEAEDWWGALDE